MATTRDGHGYYLVTRQGTIAAFGNAQLFGPSVASQAAPVTGLTVATDGFGYTLASSTGLLTSFGSGATNLVNLPAGGRPVVGLAAS